MKRSKSALIIVILTICAVIAGAVTIVNFLTKDDEE